MDDVYPVPLHRQQVEAYFSSPEGIGAALETLPGYINKTTHHVSIISNPQHVWIHLTAWKSLSILPIFVELNLV